MVELLGFLLLATLERVLYTGKREGDGEEWLGPFESTRGVSSSGEIGIGIAKCRGRFVKTRICSFVA